MPLIHHTRRGSGRPPLVFVHGFGCARSDWDEIAARFGDRHETVAVDLGGHGTTPGTAAHSRIETHGADVAELIEALQLQPVVIFGHSMGCRVAMEAALRVPQRIKAVVLVDGSRMADGGAPAQAERAAAMERLGYHAFIRSAFEQMFEPHYDKAKAQAIIQRALDRDPAIAGPLFVDIGRYDIANWDRVAASIKVPMLAIQTTYTNSAGKRVPMTAGQDTPYLQALRRAKPDARIEIIPATGHFPQLERPAETNAFIASFLEGLPK
ncbi:MAG: alpha/beta fold hydrolase [Hyphomicrobiaceae bacterium]